MIQAKVLGMMLAVCAVLTGCVESETAGVDYESSETTLTCGEGTQLDEENSVCVVAQSTLDQAFEEGIAAASLEENEDGQRYEEGCSAGRGSVDLTRDNEEACEEVFTEGVNSVDITSDNQDVYEEAFAEGVASVDITIDNQDAFDEGVASVDTTS